MHNPHALNIRISAYNVDRTSSDLEPGGRVVHKFGTPERHHVIARVKMTVV